MPVLKIHPLDVQNNVHTVLLERTMIWKTFVEKVEDEKNSLLGNTSLHIIIQLHKINYNLLSSWYELKAIYIIMR